MKTLCPYLFNIYLSIVLYIIAIKKIKGIELNGLYPLTCASDNYIFVTTRKNRLLLNKEDLEKKENITNVTSNPSSDLLCFEKDHYYLIGGPSTLVIIEINTSLGNIQSNNVYDNNTLIIEGDDKFVARKINSSMIIVSWYSKDYYDIVLLNVQDNRIIFATKTSIRCYEQCAGIICNNYDLDNKNILCISEYNVYINYLSGYAVFYLLLN